MRLTVQGKQKPKGRVRVSGAKNAATRLMAAALLSEEPVTLTNFPTELLDARKKGAFIQSLGASVVFDAQRNDLIVNAKGISASDHMSFDVPIRTTYLLAAGQLLQTGLARIPYPGGCRLGERKYDMHVMVWERFGGVVRELADHIEVRCPRLKGAEIDFPITTVGGTENALLCATVAEGTSVIRNAYITPEVDNLILLLRSMGGSIHLQGRSHVIVQGRPFLHGATAAIMPDRIEALTWIVYATMAEGHVLIEDVPFGDMEIPLLHLQFAGVDFFRNRNSVLVLDREPIATPLQPFEAACGTHPGIISDMQPFYVLLALKAVGRSLIVDYRYPDRTAYLKELERFAPGAIQWEPGRIRVHGPAKLRAAAAVSTDLRGSMAVLLAALLADGTSRVDGVEMALRGYNALEAKLAALNIQAEFEP